MVYFLIVILVSAFAVEPYDFGLFPWPFGFPSYTAQLAICSVSWNIYLEYDTAVLPKTNDLLKFENISLFSLQFIKNPI